MLPSHHGSHFFFRFLEIDTKQCVAIETELKNIVVQYFLKPVCRKVMESLTLSVCLFYLGKCYDSLIACISQMTRWADDTVIVFIKKRTQEWPGWRCGCRILSGKQQERQGTGNLCIMSSWEQLGQARHCAEECYGWNSITCNTVQIQPCHHPSNTTSPEDLPAAALAHCWGLSEEQEIWLQVHIAWGMHGISCFN